MKWLNVLTTIGLTAMAIAFAVSQQWPLFGLAFVLLCLVGPGDVRDLFSSKPKGGTIPPRTFEEGEVRTVLSKGVEPVPIPGEDSYVREPHKAGTLPESCSICRSVNEGRASWKKA